MTPEQLHHHILHLQLLQQKDQPAGNQQTGGELPGGGLLQETPGVSQRSYSNLNDFMIVNNATPNGTPNDDDPKIAKNPRGRPRKTSEAPTPTPPKKKQKLATFHPPEPVSFETLAFDVAHSLGKPHQVPHNVLLHMHIHMKENMSKLIKHTVDQLNEAMTQFESNSNLVIASMVHNYSSLNYPCLDSSSSEDVQKELFNMVKRFEQSSSSTPTPLNQ